MSRIDIRFVIAFIVVVALVTYVWYKNYQRWNHADEAVEECISACKHLAKIVDLSHGLCIYADRKGFSCSAVSDCRSYVEGKTIEILLNSGCEFLEIKAP